MVAIGLGEQIDEAELNVIATQPASENAISLRNFSDLADTDKVEMLIEKVIKSKFFVTEVKHFAYSPVSISLLQSNAGFK